MPSPFGELQRFPVGSGNANHEFDRTVVVVPGHRRERWTELRRHPPQADELDFRFAVFEAASADAFDEFRATDTIGFGLPIEVRE